MNVLYRHEDGRLIEVKGDDARAEVWLLYPHRELLKTVPSLEAAKAALPEGFTADAAVFCPPCPKCDTPSPMSLESGMYVCRECDTAF